MDLALFEPCTADALRRHGLFAPGGREAWFSPGPNGDHALFVTPDAAQCWCYSRIDDRTLCVFFSPSHLRFGVDRCGNKNELLSFLHDKHPLPSESHRVHLFGSITSGEWRYLGKPVLNYSFGIVNSLNQFEPNQFSISLDEKLPERLWLEFGGYRGWLICMYPHQFVVQRVSEADSLLRTYWGAESPHLEITRYEGDCLSATTDVTGASVVNYFYCAG